MAKAKKGKKKSGERVRILVTSDLIKSLKGQGDLPYVIMSASLKDEFCNYRYVVTKDIGENDGHSVEGSKMVTDDLIEAFHKLNVHYAAIDDVFKHQGVEVDNINNFHTHDAATLYSVSGFKVTGSDENECVVLTGNKYISCSGTRINFDTPKIPIGNTSSYKWPEELKEAVDKVRLEVSLYKEGKYMGYEESETPNPTQMTIGNAIEENKMFIPGGFQTMESKANKVDWDGDNQESNGPDLTEEFEQAKA